MFHRVVKRDLDIIVERLKILGGKDFCIDKGTTGYTLGYIDPDRKGFYPVAERLTKPELYWFLKGCELGIQTKTEEV